MFFFVFAVGLCMLSAIAAYNTLLENVCIYTFVSVWLYESQIRIFHAGCGCQKQEKYKKQIN